MKLSVMIVKTEIEIAEVEVGDIDVGDHNAISKLAINVLAALAPASRVSSHTQFIPIGVPVDNATLSALKTEQGK